MLDTVRQQIAAAPASPAREDRYFGGARLDDDDLRDAAEDDRQRPATDRAHHAEATAGNLGLGDDMRAVNGGFPAGRSSRRVRPRRRRG